MGTSEQEDIQNVLPLFFSKILIVELFTPYFVYQVIICKELLVKLKQLEGGIKLLFTHNGVAQWLSDRLRMLKFLSGNHKISDVLLAVGCKINYFSNITDFSNIMQK